MTSEESVTLFSQGNSTTKKTCFHSEIFFHQGRVFHAPLSLEITIEMMGQLEAVNVPGTPHSASWQPGCQQPLHLCDASNISWRLSHVYLWLKACCPFFFQEWPQDIFSHINSLPSCWFGGKLHLHCYPEQVSGLLRLQCIFQWSLAIHAYLCIHTWR